MHAILININTGFSDCVLILSLLSVFYSKMADAARKITVSQPAHDEDDLPLPPPPPVPPRPLDYEGSLALSSLPVPPPKESFTTFYQQRQKSELKRLFKHIHPDLRASLDDAVDDEIIKVVQSESSQAADAAYQGEVQSMRWIFENCTLDNIGDPHETKKLLHTEEMKGGDVRNTSSKFEFVNSTRYVPARSQTSVRGDVRTSTWLFETQPLDHLSKSRDEEGELVEAVLKEPTQSGDVRGARLLFETKPLSDLGRCDSIEDCSILKLKSELQEQKGDVQKTVKLFQTEPCCAIRDNSGNIYEIKSICREEINSGTFSTTRWLFETQPLDMINKESDRVKIIRGISLEEAHKGGFDQKRWMFETQSFDTIQEYVGEDMFEAGEADVNRKKLLETQHMTHDITGGDVKTSLWLFETQPMETLSDSYEVGSLKRITISAEEQGQVQGKKLIFENGHFQTNTSVKEQEIEKGDVKGFKQLFETIPLGEIARLEEEEVETKESTASGATKKCDKAMLETTPLYAIKDIFGNLHEVTTVSREEFVQEKVKNYKWMFETKPLDQMTDGKGSVEVIKGITRQEDATGDVKMAKWLFETQTLDGIHCKFNQTEKSSVVTEESCKGDVQTCRWLFETQPVDMLYEKMEKVKHKESVDANVKSITWLFESQPLDSIKDGEPYSLKLCSAANDSVKPEISVQTVKHIFETEPLDRIKENSDSEPNLRYSSQVSLQTGDVSRVKELFESQSLEEIGSETVTMSEGQNLDKSNEEGSVHKFTWMFENCPMNQINKDNNQVNKETVDVIERGDVQNKKFIFETSSLDKIMQEPIEQRSVSAKENMSNADVRSSTMMFESLPLYAIRDKEGQFHEVTTARKEEIMSGDVRGARWMFETKPLDAIKEEKEVYVIRAVTQEDVKKGNVKSARWRFETQPLDSFTDQDEPAAMVTEEDFGGCNVQLTKQMFESDQSGKKFARMVSVTDMQRGDVRTSTWLFENQILDSLKGEPQEQSPMKTVHREDSQKGDVKRCTWLFESQSLDKIKKPEETSDQSVEEIPKADVKCTTWLFETTPLDKITASNVADTLSYLYEMNFVHSSGIIIESNEGRNVKMAKYLLDNIKGVQIEKEDIVAGNIRNIMLQLLLKPTIKPQITLLREIEKSKVNTVVMELPSFESRINIESDQRVQNIVQMTDELLVYEMDFKKGIIIQEIGEGKAEMSVYSLICNNEIKTESQIMERGDVKTTIGNLLATANSQITSTRVDVNEKGNVNLYKSCIEKGDLQYLKSLHAETFECEANHSSLVKEQVETVQGGVEEAKRNLCQQKEQVEKSVCDVLPGDVKNTKKVFSSECFVNVDSSIPKEEIIPGDVSSAKQQLAVKQPLTVDKEDIVPGDIKATLESLERAKQQSLLVEREVIKPGTIYDIDLSSQDPVEEASQSQKEVIISGNVKAAKKSLEMAKQQSLHVEREVVVPGKIYNLGVSAQEESSSTMEPPTSASSSRCQPVKTNPKVSNVEKEQESQASFETAALVRNHPVRSTQPFITCDFNSQAVEDEIEQVVRGDVKATIRSLQSAATEQKLIDKENVVRGNVQFALESLEKSSVNVSKGDFKAAMIYRNSGRACSGRSKTVHNQCVVVSVPPSDTKLSPSISVTCEGQQSISTQISAPSPVANGNYKSPSHEKGTVPPLLEKKEQKPALPPKPQWMKCVSMEGQNTLPAPSPKVTCPVERDISAGMPPKQNQQLLAHSEDKQGEITADGRNNREHLHETSQQSSVDGSVQGSNKSNENLTTNIQEDKEQIKTPTERKSNVHLCSDKVEMERNVIQKINAAEEIQMCTKNSSEDGNCEMNVSLQTALQNFERKDREALDGRTLPLKKIKVVYDNRQSDKAPAQQHKHNPDPSKVQHRSQQRDSTENKLDFGDQVVLREKKVRETDEERRQRLSVHKDEIMKGNVQAAMEIFDNLRKREELKGILSQVQEIEGEACSVDSSSLKTLYENVPTWMVTPGRNAKKYKKEEKKVEVSAQDDDLESISSVEMAFEDLEKASKEIMKLKEQTLAKLVDIEETIKKALYSVSNLKSEADIAGLSGLFDESLKSEQSLQPAGNIRKISIVSSKSKLGSTNETRGLDSSLSKREMRKQANKKSLVRQSSSQSSPSFISIHSSRKPTEPLKPTMSTFKPNLEEGSSKQNRNPERKVSVLEVQAVPETHPEISGTKTVSETYEENDAFGSVFVSSTTSTFITNHSDRKPSALFGAAGGQTRYEVMTSPLLQRSERLFEDKVSSSTQGEGAVFVTFGKTKEKQK